MRLKVAIKNEHRSGQPFSLKTRIGVAFVFSFWGEAEDVREFMRRASHKTRSYFVHARGLRGFLV